MHIDVADDWDFSHLVRASRYSMGTAGPNRELQISVGTAGPQPDARENVRTDARKNA